MTAKQTALVEDAAAALAAAPADLGAWLALAEALESAGRRGEAARALSSLGEAASKLGRVALAVACARRLDELGLAKAAGKLSAAIARTHGKGSKVVDPALRTIPPLMVPPVPATPASPEGAGKAVDAALAAATAAAKKRAPASLSPTALVSGLEPADLRELVSLMALRRVAAGETIIEIGDAATALFWVARGTLEVRRGAHLLGELRPNSFFGEIALVGGTTRTARVVAVEPCLLLELPADAVEKIAERAPRLARVLASHARARLLANVMRTSELFARLSDDERAALLPLFETKLFDAGARVVSAGEDNDHLYVVASGRCEVRDGDAVTATLEVGDGLGEISLLARKPAIADVVATERSVLLALSRVTFDQIAVKHPTLLAEVYRLLVEREQEDRAMVHDAADLIL